MKATPALITALCFIGMSAILNAEDREAKDDVITASSAPEVDVAAIDPLELGGLQPMPEFPKLCKVTVTLHDGDTQVSKFIAYCSPEDEYGTIFAEGPLSFAKERWLVDFSLNLATADDDNDCELRVYLFDTAYAKVDSEKNYHSLRIFAVRQHSKGMGNYLLGEIEGMALRVSIEEAANRGKGKRK